MSVCAWGRLVSTVALFACAAAAADTDGSLSADTLAKVLAGVTYVKELGNIDNAKHAMTLFTNVADAHIGEARAELCSCAVALRHLDIAADSQAARGARGAMLLKRPVHEASVLHLSKLHPGVVLWYTVNRR